jgi:hypothetical protein
MIRHNKPLLNNRYHDLAYVRHLTAKRLLVNEQFVNSLSFKNHYQL